MKNERPSVSLHEVTSEQLTDIQCPELEGLQLYPKVTTGPCHDHMVDIVIAGGQL